MTLLPLLVAALALEPAGAPPAAAWRFVAPPPGDPFEHPPLRALGLSPEKPDDVVEKLVYRGHRRRYAQLRYGSPGSTRVTIVVDEAGPGEADLYVDADRNRRIEPKDRVAGQGPLWRLPLDVAAVEGESTRATPRAVVFRLGATGRTLSVAAAGYLEGTVRLAGRAHAARRTDGDADGSFTGPQDRVWIDRNDDGRWDPVAEQFLYAAILTIGAERYAVRSDPQGTRLAFEPLEGTGTVRLVVQCPETRERLVEVHALMTGRDGSALNVDGSGGVAEVTAPVGEYRLSALTLVLTDPAGGRPWHFSFSDISVIVGWREPLWHKVEKGRVLDLDPAGRLELTAQVAAPPAERKRGAPVTVQPRLYTGDGLLIVYSYRGSPAAPGADRVMTAHVALCSASGEALDGSTSGFT
jgi:hypothetical protein